MAPAGGGGRPHELIAQGQSRFDATVEVFQGKRAVSLVRLKQVVFASVPRERGADELDAIMPHAWGVASRSSAAEWLGLQDDEVHEGYTFTVLQPATAR